MLISASRRTDIPARFTPWLLRRLREGFVLVRNPMNPRQVSRVPLDPGRVDGMVLWTKNPLPLLPELPALQEYMTVFQFSLTPYGKDLEPGLPDKAKELLPAFQRLAKQIGPRRVIWRYDPILLNPVYTRAFHLRAFKSMAKRLTPYVNKCVFSFLDPYPCMSRAAREQQVQYPAQKEREGLAAELAAIARGLGLELSACAEDLPLKQLGITPAACVDARLFESLLGRPLSLSRDRNQRPRCACSQSVDIGAYNCCPNGCVYCYANHGSQRVRAGLAAHDPASPMLLGWPGPEDRISQRL